MGSYCNPSLSRVTPKQKADVVGLVRTKVNDSITLAIGDGANDVSMIQVATLLDHSRAQLTQTSHGLYSIPWSQAQP